MSQGSGEHAAAETPVPGSSSGEPPLIESRPLLTVQRGEPTAAELAALTVVVDALVRSGQQHPEPERHAGSRWAAKERLVRPPLRPGPGTWRTSALPR
jgi:hypothetical protein